MHPLLPQSVNLIPRNWIRMGDDCDIPLSLIQPPNLRPNRPIQWGVKCIELSGMASGMGADRVGAAWAGPGGYRSHRWLTGVFGLYPADIGTGAKGHGHSDKSDRTEERSTV